MTDYIHCTPGSLLYMYNTVHLYCIVNVYVQVNAVSELTILCLADLKDAQKILELAERL